MSFANIRRPVSILQQTDLKMKHDLTLPNLQKPGLNFIQYLHHKRPINFVHTLPTHHAQIVDSIVAPLCLRHALLLC